MLHRRDGRGLVLITQPAHAWVSGQCARAWGNGRFGEGDRGFEPREEVCLAAEQHDAGWAAWERGAPADPATGVPPSFMDVPTLEHLDIWSCAAEAVLVQSRYAALLVSMHGTGLYDRPRREGETDEEWGAVTHYVARERALQERLIASLRADHAYAPFVERPVLDRNRRLIAAWDLLSLAVLLPRAQIRTLPRVPMGDGAEADVRLREVEDDGAVFSLDPWPFGRDEVPVRCDGRRVGEAPEPGGGPAGSDAAARRLQEATWEVVEVRLRPA